MMKCWTVVVIAALCGCHKDTAPMPEPQPPASTAELDALWAKEPAGATIGVVVSPRGLSMLEHAWHDVHGFLKTFPEFAPVEQEMSTALADSKLTTDLTLASIGLAPGKGFAFFLDAHQHGMALLPVVDRDRFLAIAHGTKGKDGDTFDDGSICKPLDGWYACADEPAMLGTLGKGGLRHELAVVGARGDIEAVVTAPAKGAAVVQLAHGSVVMRGVVDGVPSSFIQKLGPPAHPRADLAHDVGFGVIDLAPFVAGLPPLQLVDGVTAADLGNSIGGPLTISATAGAVVEMRIPLKDSAPVSKLIAHCGELPMFAARLEHGTCHVAIPQAPRGLDIWIEGKELRIGTQHGAAEAPSIQATSIGKELARGTWQVAFWGRGTVLGPMLVPMSARALPPALELAARALVMVNELGLGVTNDGDRLRVVAALRTAWANPDDVVAKLQAVAPADLLAGKGAALGKAIVDRSPRAPFAADYPAGTMGFAPPILIGALLAVASFEVYSHRMQRSAEPDGAALAALIVRRYAFEAFPQWAVAHPDQACPASLADLAPYVSGPPAADPWGHPYQMACGAKLPPGAKGIAVWSVGPDGQTGTADDVTSWK